MTPQTLVTLSPSGDLQVELPGPNGMRRTVKLDTASAGYTLKRILSAQLTQPVEVGRDSAPTGGQVKHWEEHADSPSETCPWCIAEALGLTAHKEARPSLKRASLNLGDGCSAKHLPPRGLKKSKKSQQSAKPQQIVTSVNDGTNPEDYGI